MILVHLQAEVDELLERLGKRQRGVVIPLFGGKPGADSGPRLLGLGEFQLDLRPEFREDAHRRPPFPRVLCFRQGTRVFLVLWTFFPVISSATVKTACHLPLFFLTPPAPHTA